MAAVRLYPLDVWKVPARSWVCPGRMGASVRGVSAEHVQVLVHYMYAALY